jgi:heterogeneous nuclear ribonucleoprotein A1/A3
MSPQKQQAPQNQGSWGSNQNQGGWGESQGGFNQPVNNQPQNWNQPNDFGNQGINWGGNQSNWGGNQGGNWGGNQGGFNGQQGPGSGFGY